MSLSPYKNPAGVIVGYRGDVVHRGRRHTKRWRLRKGTNKTIIRQKYDRWCVGIWNGSEGVPKESFGSPTLATFLPHYLTEARGALSPEWFARIERTVPAILAHFGADTPLDAITRADVAAFRAALLARQAKGRPKGQTLSRVTVNLALTVLLRIFRVAIEWSDEHARRESTMARPDGLDGLHVERNPAAGMLIKRSGKATSAGTYIRPAIAAAFFAYLLDGRPWPPAPGETWDDARPGRAGGRRYDPAVPVRVPLYVVVDITSGLRSKEMRRLDWRWISLEERVIEVPPGKSLEHRRIGIPREAAAALAVLPYRRGLVFPDAQRILYALVRRMKSFGLPTTRPHDLRHTWATNFRKAGGDLRLLKEQGGWRTWEMVERYAHVDDEERVAAADRMDAYVTGRAGAGGTSGGTSARSPEVIRGSERSGADPDSAASEPVTATSARRSRR